MAKSIKNIAASVHQRLLNKAKESSCPFNELLQHYAKDFYEIWILSRTFDFKGEVLAEAVEKHLRKETHLSIRTPLYSTLRSARMGTKMFNGRVSSGRPS
jgi:hypothetical protein